MKLGDKQYYDGIRCMRYVGYKSIEFLALKIKYGPPDDREKAIDAIRGFNEVRQKEIDMLLETLPHMNIIHKMKIVEYLGNTAMNNPKVTNILTSISSNINEDKDLRRLALNYMNRKGVDTIQSEKDK